MTVLGIIIAVVGAVFYYSGKSAGSRTLEGLGKGILIIGLLFIFFSFILDVKLVLTPVTEELEPVPTP
ncbi:MAG: hypothetical protein ACLFVS_03275 [Candidatus Acetothermia bacterium]